MTQSDITDLLKRSGAGDKKAIDQLVPAMYDELHSLAHQRLRRERNERSLHMPHAMAIAPARRLPSGEPLVT